MPINQRLSLLGKIVTLIVAVFLSTIALAQPGHKENDHCYVDGLSDRLRCGYVKVAENPSNPNGRKINIHYAVIPAVKNIYPNQAFLAIAGGPGQSAIDNAPLFDNTFGQVRETRDILLIDQRGTGRSNILQCPEDKDISPLLINGDDFDSVAETKKCLASIDSDVAQYTSTNALNDFEVVRKFLGYDKLHVYGISYGSRMAQLYMREHAEALATVTLDGVVPMQQSVLAIGLAIDRAFNLLISDCESQDQCQKQFPSIREALANIESQLLLEPIKTQIFHPMTAQPTEFLLTHDKFLGVIRLALYSPNTRALLPHAIDQAGKGNYQAILGLYSLSMEGMDIAMGMHASVVCSEDIHRLSTDLSAELEQSYIGKTMFSELSKVCSVWPSDKVDESFSAPVSNNIPTLLLSGELDPATPPDWAKLAMTDMKNAKHLIAPYAAHGVAMQSCANRIVAQLVEQESTVELNGDCLKEGRARGFYLNASGIDIFMPSTEQPLKITSEEVL
ncbi:MAG: alpha/beta hydrolase [Porticoccaceae bacterium]|nr:alpha/beta hydrolase [Porticoccaceae bacterium]